MNDSRQSGDPDPETTSAEFATDPQAARPPDTSEGDAHDRAGFFPWDGDGLADWGERPPPLRVDLDDTRSRSPRGPAAAGQGLAFPGRPRLLAMFGVAVVAVAGVSMFLGWVWGSSAGSESRSAPEASETRSDGTLRSQAKAVDGLLEGSTSARSKVVEAVVNVRQCRGFGRSAQDLRAAARERERMVTRLRKLDVSELPDGDEIVSSLSRAWAKSAEADRAFANWTEEASAPGGCTDGEPVQGSHYRTAVRASSAAGEAKSAFVRHWNPVAAKAGLPARNEDGI